jgi:hypothetical protein
MRAIAFYLPQFHPIPENDRWWGAGFTEWHNVARARPRFRGHQQPQLPERLGFYDLRLAATRQAQAELAREHGIEGFCYYHFWFNGRMLLEQPLNEVLTTGHPDFPFCICWANENWTRRWDGGDHEILLGQDYAAYDAQAHIRWLRRAFSDPRYITVAGRPLLLIYNAAAISDLAARIRQWREAARDLGIADEVASNLSDYLVTEAGFGSDLGAEKFCNIVSRFADFEPNAVALVASVRALKYHGKDMWPADYDELEAPEAAETVIAALAKRGYGLGWGETDLVNRWRETEIAVQRDQPLEPLVECAQRHGLRVVDTGFAYHVYAPEMSKGTALDPVAATLGYEPGDFAAIGDSANDVELFNEVDADWNPRRSQSPPDRQ